MSDEGSPGWDACDVLTEGPLGATVAAEIRASLDDVRYEPNDPRNAPLTASACVRDASPRHSPDLGVHNIRGRT